MKRETEREVPAFHTKQKQSKTHIKETNYTHRSAILDNIGDPRLLWALIEKSRFRQTQVGANKIILKQKPYNN